MGTVHRKVRLVCGGFLGMLGRRKLRGVRASNRGFSASCRRTVTLIPTPSRRGGKGVLSYMRANCGLGSGMVHRTGMIITRWAMSWGSVTGESCCRILRISGATALSIVGGTCHGGTVRCRPSGGPKSGRTRRGFGRTTRTCSILDGPSGHTHCSRFKRTKVDKTTNNNFRKFKRNVSVSSVFSVFNSVFNKRKKNFKNFKNFNNNKHSTRHGFHNSSLHMGMGLGLGRVSAKMRGGFGLGGCMAYSRYRNSKTRKRKKARAYPAYRKAKDVAHARRDVFKVIRSRDMYPRYGKRKGVVGGGYGTYTKRNVMCKRRIIRIGVPTNITRKVRLSIGKGKGTNGRGNIPNSLLIIVRRRSRPSLVHSRGSLVCGLLLDIPATTLKNAMRVPAVSDGMGMGVRPNARPNGILHLENGKLPGIGDCNCDGNANSLLIGMDMCVPRALGGSRGRTLRGVRRSSGFGPGADVGRGVFGGFGGFFSWFLCCGISRGRCRILCLPNVLL